MITITRQLLIVLSLLSILLSAMLIAGGAVALRIEPIPNVPTIISQFHDRLGSRVGTVYDAAMHRELSSLIVSNERTINASFKVYDSIGKFATTVGILVLFSSLASLSLVLRSATLKT